MTTPDDIEPARKKVRLATTSPESVNKAPFYLQPLNTLRESNQDRVGADKVLPSGGTRMDPFTTSGPERFHGPTARNQVARRGKRFQHQRPNLLDQWLVVKRRNSSSSPEPMEQPADTDVDNMDAQSETEAMGIDDLFSDSPVVGHVEESEEADDVEVQSPGPHTEDAAADATVAAAAAVAVAVAAVAAAADDEALASGPGQRAVKDPLKELQSRKSKKKEEKRKKAGGRITDYYPKPGPSAAGSSSDHSPRRNVHRDAVSDSGSEGASDQDDDGTSRGVPISDMRTTPSCSAPLPPLKAQDNHTVTIRTDLLQAGSLPVPYPTHYKDAWDDVHVKMPCSDQNLFPDGDRVRSRWALIEETLRQPFQSSEDLKEAILTYNATHAKKWDFTALHEFVKYEFIKWCLGAVSVSWRNVDLDEVRTEPEIENSNKPAAALEKMKMTSFTERHSGRGEDVEKDKELRTHFTREEIQHKVNLYNAATRDHLKMTLHPSGLYTGFIKVQLELRRPITVHSGAGGGEKKKGGGQHGGGGGEAFYLPRGAVNTLHVSSSNTVAQVIAALLNKFTVADNPAKFALYKRCKREEQEYMCKLAEEEQPLFLRLLAGPNTDTLSFVLREKQTGEVMWDAFSIPELQNFLRILEKEEAEHLQNITDRYSRYRHRLEEALQSTHTGD